MSAERIPASFRGTSGFLFRRYGIVYRQAGPASRDDYGRMMKSGFCRFAVEAGLLVPHEKLPPETQRRWRRACPKEQPKVTPA